jgi:hypothetical protein
MVERQEYQFHSSQVPEPDPVGHIVPFLPEPDPTLTSYTNNFNVGFKSKFDGIFLNIKVRILYQQYIALRC